MNEENRKFIEDILKYNQKEDLKTQQPNNPKGMINQLHYHQNVKNPNISHEEQIYINQLQKDGFKLDYIYQAITAIKSTHNNNKVINNLDQIKNWLLLNLNENQLPLHYNPQGKQFEVIYHHQAANKSPNSNDNSNNILQKIQEIISLNYYQSIPLFIIKNFMTQAMNIKEINLDQIADILTYIIQPLFNTLQQHVVGCKPSELTPKAVPNNDDDEYDINEEIEILKSIYDDCFIIETFENKKKKLMKWIIKQDQYQIIFYLHKKHPYEVPLFFIHDIYQIDKVKNDFYLQFYLYIICQIYQPNKSIYDDIGTINMI